MMYHYNTVAQEMRFISIDDPDSKLQILQPRQQGLEYYATHHGNSFYIITNKDAYNGKLVKAPISAPGIENWQDIVPHREDVLLEYIDTFADHFVLHERKNGLKQLRISKTDGISDVVYVKFPDQTYEVSVEANWAYDKKDFRIRYSSLSTPYTVANIDMATGAWDILKEDQIPNGYDKNSIRYRIYSSHSSGREACSNLPGL